MLTLTLILPLTLNLTFSLTHINRKERASEMWKELTEAKQKLTQMEHVVRTAERNLDVSRLDQSDLSASLACNVGKLERLLGQAKSMRKNRANVQIEIVACRRRQRSRLKVMLHMR